MLNTTRICEEDTPATLDRCFSLSKINMKSLHCKAHGGASEQVVFQLLDSETQEYDVIVM